MNDDRKTKQQLKDELASLRRRVAELEARAGQPDQARRTPLPGDEPATADVLRFVASHSPDHVLVQDRDLRYTFVLNPQLGLTAADMIGKTDCDILAPADAEKLIAVKRMVLETGQPHQFATSLPNRSGGIEYFDGTYIPRLDPAGQVDGLVGYFRNITEPRQAEEARRESEERFRALADVAPAGIYLTDVDGKCLFANQRWCEMAGLSLEQALGDGWAEGVHPDDRRAIHCSWRRMVESHGRWGLEYRFQTPNGITTWVYGLAAALHDPQGNVAGYVGINSDITERKLAEESLRETEERLRLTLEATHTGTWRLNLDSGEFRSDELGKLLHGFAADEPLCSLEEASRHVYPDDMPEMQRRFAEAVQCRGKYAYEYRVVLPDGRTRWIASHGQVLANAPLMMGIVQDVTERKLAEEALRVAQERLAMAADAAQVGLYELNVQTREAAWTRQHDLIFGTEPSAAHDMAPHHYREFAERVHPDDLPGVEQTIRDALEGRKPYRAEYRIVRPDGEIHWIVARGTASYDAEGRATRLRGTVTDITERKRVEEELVRARDAAEAANRAKSGFLANMSHEIRTPMTAILGLTDFLICSDGTTPEQQEHLQIIQRNGQALLELINAILDLAKIESGGAEVQRRECSVVSLVDEVLSLLGVQARKKGLELKVDYRYPLPQTVRTDPARLRQILVNLVGNAIKFTDRGSVRVGVSLADGADGKPCLQFAVRDTGIGISPADHDKLFKPFSQVDSAYTRKYGGSGLGLVISRHFAKTLGGDIQMESQPGLGSTFTLRIAPGPLNDSRMLSRRLTEPAAAEATPAQWQLRGRVLLAEDGVDNQRVIKLLLEKAGLAVDVAEDGLEACRKATSSVIEGSPYDVIFMDIHMPAMDGYEATARLRQLGWKRPIVAVTANAMVGDREKCLAAGCDDYLAKPVTRQDLLATAARHLARRDDTPV